MKKAYRYRFYPTELQKELLARTFGCCRFIYNHFLELKKEQWEENEQSLSYLHCSKLLPTLKEEYIWLKEVSSVCLQQTLRHLNVAYQSFFSKHARYPRFKRRDQTQSCTFMKNAFTYQAKTLSLAKIGKLDIRWSRPFIGAPSSVTVSKDSAGRYFISLLLEEEVAPLAFVKKEVGIDLGISQMITDHQGAIVSSPSFLGKALKRLRKRQKSLSRKTKGSKNREKTRLRLAKLHAKIRDSRLDFLHKLSTQLIHENQVIVAESLGVKKMLEQKRLSRKIADAGWGIFLRLLDYKSRWYGRTFVQIDQYFPSSKTCHSCGSIKQDLQLAERCWSCRSCDLEHHRDKNAAKNILQEGLRLLNEKVPRGSRDLKPVELV